jgi:hypothetical protein
MYQFHQPRAWSHTLSIACIVILASTRVFAQSEFELEPISYYDRPLHDPISRLQERIGAGTASLAYDSRHGYMPAVLQALDISTTSQMLVFSKTSFQLTRIAPNRPRAVYFNDHTYIGWVQGGDVVEVSTVDPEQGAVFYTLYQEETDRPRFVRDKGQCLACHASTRTQNVPGHLVRSVYTSPSGQPNFGSGTFTTDDRSPFEQRWGGWYVSGKHGQMRHMGNVISRDRDNPEQLDREAGANITDLSPLVDVRPYLKPSSDIVALMVLEHQTQMHNAITAANYTARRAAHQDRIVNEALQRPLDQQSDSTKRRIASAGDKLLAHLLFSGELTLTSPIEGVSGFTEEFANRGPKDSRGRSLRDFDLQRRIFKYPCSYLIYSPSFDALPKSVQQYVAARLSRILTGEDTDPSFAHLSADDRRSIREILQDTKPDLFAEVLATTAGPDAVTVPVGTATNQ